MGNKHCGEPANGHSQVLPCEWVQAELGPQEGESKWVAADSGNQWRRVVDSTHIAGLDCMCNRLVLTDRRLELEMDHRAERIEGRKQLLEKVTLSTRPTRSRLGSSSPKP